MGRVGEVEEEKCRSTEVGDEGNGTSSSGGCGVSGSDTGSGVGPSVHGLNGVGGSWLLDLFHVLGDHVMQGGVMVPDL